MTRSGTVHRPHVLMIVVDQMAHDAIGALGHPAVLTPHLDALVRRGTTFTNAYCASPLCAPSRASLMTGVLPRHHRVYDNGAELPASVPTMVHHLNRAGYTTVLAGKMHFVGPDQLHGFAERLTTDIAPTGLELTPDWRAGPVPNPGTSVNRLRYPPVVDWSLQLAYDDEVLHAALARLRALARGDTPFFLCASFAHPHDPFLVTRQHWDRYDGRVIPAPRVGARPTDELHPYDRWIQIHHEADRFPLSPEEVQEARRAYYAAVSYVDDLVGRLLTEADRLGLLDDAVVVFTSDHGEMLGEHGMWFKRTYRDGAAKVPLVIAVPGPGVRGATPAERRPQVVSLMDLTATLVDLAQAPQADEHIAAMDGRSLRALLPGGAGTAGWTDAARSEYVAEGTIEPMLLLRRRSHKLVLVRGHDPMLFDLDADPDEARDLSGDPRHADLVVSMTEELLGGLDLDVLRSEVLTSQADRLLTIAGTPPRGPWAPQPAAAPWSAYPRPEA